MSKTYVALVHKANKKTADYGVFFPDFPGCVFGGANMQKALDNAKEGLIFHIDGMLENGEHIPEPSSIEEIMRKGKNKQAMPALVNIVVPKGQLKRINISVDASLVSAIDHAILHIRCNRSEFMAEAARRMLA
jgi:predicted RNase H-like HicB family nuclease